MTNQIKNFIEEGEKERVWIFIAYKNDGYGNVPIFSRLFNNHSDLKDFSAKHSAKNKSKVIGYNSDYLDLTDKQFISSRQISLIKKIKEMCNIKKRVILDKIDAGDNKYWKSNRNHDMGYNRALEDIITIINNSN